MTYLLFFFIHFFIHFSLDNTTPSAFHLISYSRTEYNSEYFELQRSNFGLVDN